MEKVYAQQGKELKEIETNEREGLNKYWSQEEVKAILAEHEKILFPIFKVFAT
jgi:hypothetical protein